MILFFHPGFGGHDTPRISSCCLDQPPAGDLPKSISRLSTLTLCLVLLDLECRVLIEAPQWPDPPMRRQGRVWVREPLGQERRSKLIPKRTCFMLRQNRPFLLPTDYLGASWYRLFAGAASSARVPLQSCRAGQVPLLAHPVSYHLGRLTKTRLRAAAGATRLSAVWLSGAYLIRCLFAAQAGAQQKSRLPQEHGVGLGRPNYAQ